MTGCGDALPRERELELVLAAGGGDPAARAELVATFLPVIGGMARRYHGVTLVERDELMQEGVVGLLRALARYDAGFGTPFWAYASWWVRQAMQQLVAEMTGPLVLSDRALRMLARVKEARREHLRAHGREPMTSEIATITGLTLEQVMSLLAAEQVPRGLDESAGDGSDEGLTVGGRLRDADAEQAYERVVDRLALDAVRSASECLTDRERAVIHAHYGLGCPAQTLREIAGTLGVSAERVRQIEVQALEKLRATVASPPLPCPSP